MLLSFYQSFVQLKFPDQLNLILFEDDSLVFDQQLLLFLDNQPKIKNSTKTPISKQSFFTVNGKNDD